MLDVNSFLERHQVDVGRSCGLLSLVSAVTATYGMLGEWIIGQINIDLTAVIGAVVGIALWNHRPWARKLLIVLGWFVTAAFALVLLIVPFTGTSNLRLTLGETVVAAPALWQVYIFGVCMVPACWFVLATLHSAKARTEFQTSAPPPQQSPGSSDAERG